MHLHQVWPLQRYTKVQVIRQQSDPYDKRGTGLHAERHGGLYVAAKQHIFLVDAELFRIISYLCTQKVVAQWHSLSYCSCIRAPAVLLLEIRSDALLSWTPESGKFKNLSKTGYDGSRIYVGLSSHCLFYVAFPVPKYEDFGIRRSTFFVSLPFLEAPAWVYPSVFVERLHWYTAIYLLIDRCSLKNRKRSGDLWRPPLLTFNPFWILYIV